MSWNVRGANDREKRKLIKDVIKTQKADLVCLQETKLQEMTSAIIQFPAGSRMLRMVFAGFFQEFTDPL